MHVQMGANGKELLPQAPDVTNDQCSKPDQNIFCFKAGEWLNHLFLFHLLDFN